MKKQFLYALVLLACFTAFGQQRVTTSIDTTKNKIGAQFNLTLKTTVDTSATVVFPTGTQFGALQVIRNYVVDTVKKGAQHELIKRYGLTQFDSGKYALPSLKVLINKQPFYTDSLRVEVSGIKVDTLQQKMYDIKPITAVEAPIGNWWKYLLGLLLIVAAGFGAYFLIKKYQAKKLEQEVYKTPIERATSLLKNLESKQLWQKGEIKSYYSELTDIARNYIEEEIQIPAMESTTTELINALQSVARQKNLKLSKETLKNLEKVLKQADLVKFAKSKPLDFEIEEDKKRIESSIVLIHKAVPEIVPDQDDNTLDELLREKMLKKQKKKRIILGVVSAIMLFFAVLIILIATKGFDYVKDNFIGHPTKELLKGEWILSEYGNPPVIIETPKVLKRVDITQSVPKEGMALIKSMQSFAYGSILDNFYVMVSTLKYKQQSEIDLSKSIDGSLKFLESMGAQNIIVKQEEFNTKEGITGRRGYGTYSRIDKANKESIKLYYEIIVFSQDGGLQQIIMLHEEGDKYANQVCERMINSVEFKKAAE